MPNDVNTDEVSITFIDYSGEKSTFSFANKTFLDNTAFLAAWGSLRDAVDAVTNGTRSQHAFGTSTRTGNALPTDQTAARETKLLISYEDVATFEKFIVTIPTFDRTTVTMISGTDDVKMDDAATAAALKTAVEGFVQSPRGNAVNVIGMRFVGRNN